VISCLKPTKKCDLAFDEGLAQRVTELLADNPYTTQKQMFGGMGLMISGNMCGYYGQ